jgi:hypothetical protein
VSDSSSALKVAACGNISLKRRPQPRAAGADVRVTDRTSGGPARAADPGHHLAVHPDDPGTNGQDDYLLGRVIPPCRPRNGPPTITVIAYGGRASLDQERFEIRPEHGTFTLARTVPQVDPAVILNEPEAISELGSALTGLAVNWRP